MRYAANVSPTAAHSPTEVGSVTAAPAVAVDVAVPVAVDVDVLVLVAVDVDVPVPVPVAVLVPVAVDVVYLVIGRGTSALSRLRPTGERDGWLMAGFPRCRRVRGWRRRSR